jgi:hypothetical protein
MVGWPLGKSTGSNSCSVVLHFSSTAGSDTAGPTGLQKFMARTSRGLTIPTVVTFVVTRRSDAHIQQHPVTATEREHSMIFLKNILYLVERIGRGARI